MSGTIHIDATLITESLLAQRVTGASRVTVPAGAIITPSARDYVRLNRIDLTHGTSASSPAAPQHTPAMAPPDGVTIEQVLPPGAEAGLLYRGRCDHPDRPYGCRTEEFGSGYAGNACCEACARKGSNGGPGCDCGCEEDFEALVQRLTDEIMTMLDQ